ncbi:hypothetical protein SAMN04487895_107163 [Paenibacillus sophorae]|uniref:DUF2178 domain-containing protein n=1 Tax=Paenibacillus sophorae TaxID=1333845 RepID=A0A1H8PDP5_9BACL|nr:hypothetical protein [Paenibacillus sophorae]QWU16541.1 hypothetical protein KP014_04730 [Paenibacillus sophorae]SEO40129.1 hypothetical protein SAMN04487895_107163 [Paenibacillus sophorae]
MKKSSAARNVILLVIGILLLASGLLEVGDMARNVSGLCIGVGSGLIGMSIANLIMIRYYAKHPAFKRQQEIEAGDERSIAINNLSKAKAFDVTINAMMLIPFVLILADSPLWLTLAVVAFYVFSYSIRYYYIVKYSKVM